MMSVAIRRFNHEMREHRRNAGEKRRPLPSPANPLTANEPQLLHNFDLPEH